MQFSNFTCDVIVHVLGNAPATGGHVRVAHARPAAIPPLVGYVAVHPVRGNVPSELERVPDKAPGGGVDRRLPLIEKLLPSPSATLPETKKVDPDDVTEHVTAALPVPCVSPLRIGVGGEKLPAANGSPEHPGAAPLRVTSAIA